MYYLKNTIKLKVGTRNLVRVTASSGKGGGVQGISGMIPLLPDSSILGDEGVLYGLGDTEGRVPCLVQVFYKVHFPTAELYKTQNLLMLVLM